MPRTGRKPHLNQEKTWPQSFLYILSWNICEALFKHNYALKSVYETLDFIILRFALVLMPDTAIPIDLSVKNTKTKVCLFVCFFVLFRKICDMVKAGQETLIHC